jgi:membrane protein implicated in regulation of membrane protease activity
MWLAFGMVLLFIELTTPSGFFVLFFGLGALTVGLLAGLNVSGPAWVQWLVFTVTSLVYLLLFRKRLRGRVDTSGAAIDTLVGELVIPRERIPPGEIRRADLRGTLWNARNDSPLDVESGQRCRVTGVDGLIVFIKPE